MKTPLVTKVANAIGNADANDRASYNEMAIAAIGAMSQYSSSPRLRAHLVRVIYPEVKDRHRCAYLVNRILPLCAPSIGGEMLRQKEEELYVAGRDLREAKRLLDGDAKIRLRLLSERAALEAALANSLAALTDNVGVQFEAGSLNRLERAVATLAKARSALQQAKGGES